MQAAACELHQLAVANNQSKIKKGEARNAIYPQQHAYLSQTYCREAMASFESVTQPKIPPWALIISNATRWNSGK
jgi:hypothetical protein